jgi:hypothetical protein
MSAIIVGGEGSKTIRGMFPGDDLGRITIGIFEAIAISFEEGNMRNPTHEEKKRRFTICVNWAKILRGDLAWGLARICDSMPDILRAELLGTKWEPDKRACWIPEDGR